MSTAKLAERVLVENAVGHVALTWSDGTRSRFHYVWLRDNCRHPERWSALTGERKARTEDIPLDLSAVEAFMNGDGLLQVEWSDETPPSLFSIDWLFANRYDPPRPYKDTSQQTPWDGEYAVRLSSFHYENVLNDPDTMSEMIEALLAYGLVRITDVLPEDGEVERFANCLAYVREIAFDRVADIRIKPDAYTLGFTDAALPFHTDCSGYAWPPNLMLFHCLSNDVEGGDPCYIDGARVVEELRRRDPAALETLCRVPVLHRLYSKEADTQHIAPRIMLDEAGQLAILRYANWTPQPLRPHEFSDTRAFYEANKLLAEIINDPSNEVTLKPRPGELLMINNHRVLHGRYAFDAVTGGRHFQQVYMEMEELKSLLRVQRRGESMEATL